MKWIDIEDQMPDFHVPILFYVDNGLGVMKGVFYRASHKFKAYDKHTEATFYKAEVSHWMPMPEPPILK